MNSTVRIKFGNASAWLLALDAFLAYLHLRPISAQQIVLTSHGAISVKRSFTCKLQIILVSSSAFLGMRFLPLNVVSAVTILLSVVERDPSL